MSSLNPCPICGSEVESNVSFGTAQVNCKNHDCIMIGCIMMNEPFVDEIEKKWNESYSNQELAKLKEENENLRKENDDLKKQTGYSTSFTSRTCNNCGHRDCD